MPRYTALPYGPMWTVFIKPPHQGNSQRKDYFGLWSQEVRVLSGRDKGREAGVRDFEFTSSNVSTGKGVHPQEYTSSIQDAPTNLPYTVPSTGDTQVNGKCWDHGKYQDYGENSFSSKLLLRLSLPVLCKDADLRAEWQVWKGVKYGHFNIPTDPFPIGDQGGQPMVAAAYLYVL